MAGQQRASDADQVRQQVEQLKQRVQNDPQFKEQLKNDTRGTLKSAGIPDAAIQEILQNQKPSEDADVQGYSFSVCTATYCIAYNDTWYCYNTW